ncbi:MAG: hypothetical protein A3F83_12650 [Candidatus Glassbacteria bacterium RIFCSPLOWO2_12_FULL_58_11]|uniref:Cytochrome c domain-containing protein n=1 Tax=Candidatus Glassbacteria bacterium RIFCSPLOWO2_12_FULL_58_11 TaxID=1817867 RepID=A0A1F5YWG8_9BACT|nr:MAG: hypothetical protein A3F83_12650 [Candidatus Glassbacteria bacterium RIFCSPLOWO2_12_FULL_58_11]
MNYPIWELTYIGGPSLIALIAVTHVYIAHLAVGGGVFLWLTDIKGFRENSPEIHGYLKKHISFFLLLTMVFGAVSGVGIWFIIALVNPAATTILIHNFVFGWAIEWVFFFGEIAALLIYYYYFDRMDRKTRLRIAFLYAVFAWLSLFIINGIIDFMLTSGKWIETQNFWDGFFNPTYWPSLFFRTFIAFTFAGLFGYLTTVFLEEEKFRRRMLRYCTKWLLLPMLGLIPSALWYYYAVPLSFREVAFGMNRDLPPFLHLLPGMTALIFLLGIVLSVASGRGVQKAAAFLLIPVGLFWMGGFEYTREIARKPYVIANFMYSNSIPVAEVELLNRDGVLKHAKWSAIDKVTAENRLEAGREIFNLECLACHTVGGIRNDILPLAGKFPYRGLLAQLTGMGKIRRYMPPFVGTEEEKAALAAYITSELLHREVAEPPGSPASGGALEETQIPPFDPKKDEYVLLAWNSAGMQEVSDCDELFSYLPPGNTVEAQLLKRGPQPVLISEGVELSYKVEDQHANPAGHDSFWEFSEALYGRKIEAGKGLEGKGVEGVFDWDAEKEIYRAKGVPLLPYREDGTFNAYPLVTVEARESGNGKLLASTKVAAPVSTQMDCYRCHGGEPRQAGAGISKETAAAILQAHDRNEKTSLYKEAIAGRPQLCQSCHADPSQEDGGKPEVLNLSAAMHGWHANYMSGLGDEACQYCHPLAAGAGGGLRGVHGSPGANLNCSNCHGTFEDLSISLLNRESDKPSAPAIMKNIQPRMAKSIGDIAPRTPWLENPDCFACHVDFQQPAEGATAFNHWNQSPEELYRSYRDNALIRCTGCHGSSHAIYPALNPVEKFRDVLQPMQYCGKPFAIGADKSCAVCHVKEMEDPIHHENMLRMVRDKGGFEGF